MVCVWIFYVLLKSEYKFKHVGKWFNKCFQQLTLQDGDWTDPIPFIIGSQTLAVKTIKPEFRKQKKE